MITEDEVMNLFARADPARVHEVAPVLDAASYLDTLRMRSSYITIIDTDTPTAAEPKSRPRWRIVVAAAAAVPIVGVLTLIVRDDTTHPVTELTPATTQAPSTTSADTEAVAVAIGFMDSYGAFDVDQAMTYLAADADIKALITSDGSQDVDGSREALRPWLSVLAAERYQQASSSCGVQGYSSVPGTRVRCVFDFHLMGSDDIGRGPFSGGFIDLTVLDGRIIRVTNAWGDEFSEQMWTPFWTWLTENHPEDKALMFGDETEEWERLTDESIELWRQHTAGYVESINRGAKAWP